VSQRTNQVGLTSAYEHMVIAAESFQVAASSSASRLLRVRREADAATAEHAMIYGRTAVSGRAFPLL
jgi:hypothetical protein